MKVKVQYVDDDDRDLQGAGVAQLRRGPWLAHDDAIHPGRHGSETPYLHAWGGCHGIPLPRRDGHDIDQVMGMEWAAEGEATPSQQDELQ